MYSVDCVVLYLCVLWLLWVMSYGGHSEVSRSRLPFILQITCWGVRILTHTHTHIVGVGKQMSCTYLCDYYIKSFMWTFIVFAYTHNIIPHLLSLPLDLPPMHPFLNLLSLTQLFLSGICFFVELCFLPMFAWVFQDRQTNRQTSANVICDCPHIHTINHFLNLCESTSVLLKH